MCNNCGKPIDRYGRHSLGNCSSGCGQTARHNKIAKSSQREAFVLGRIPSRREEIGLFPDAEGRPGTIYVTTEAGCTDSAYTSAAFAFTVRGAVPDNGESKALLISSCTTAGAAAHDGEKTKVSDFLRREKEVALLLLTDKGITWKRPFQFRPFGMDVFGALGPEARKAVDRFSKIRAGPLTLLVTTRST